MAKKEESVRWAEMERALAALKKSELIDLVHDLFDLSAETRNFLGARLAGRRRRSAALEPYRAIVVERFFPASGGPGDLDLALAYKAITDYRKATGNIEGVLDLMMTFVEMAARFATEYGVHDVEYFADLEAVAAEFVELLNKHGYLYPKFARRLKQMGQQLAGAVTWEPGDAMAELLYYWEVDSGSEEDAQGPHVFGKGGAAHGL